jgi:hypothetical protein
MGRIQNQSDTEYTIFFRFRRVIIETRFLPKENGLEIIGFRGDRSSESNK